MEDVEVIVDKNKYITGLNIEELEALMRQLGFSAERSSDWSLSFEPPFKDSSLHGLMAWVLLDTLDSDESEKVGRVLVTRFISIGLPQRVFTLRELNTFHRKYTFGRVYYDEQDDLVFEARLFLEDGVSIVAVVRHLQMFVEALEILMSLWVVGFKLRRLAAKPGEA
jgi:hypothetical protein